jgi:GNAT superfamily N-acetyltransferase
MVFENLKPESVDRVLPLLKANVHKALYIFTDLIYYGLDVKNIDFWVCKNGDEPVSVVMKYYTGLQIFAIEITPDVVRGIVDIIDGHPDITQIAGDNELIKALSLPPEKYEYKETYVVERPQPFAYADLSDRYRIERAIAHDAWELSEFYMGDEYYRAGYNVDDLREQMIERFITGFGRAYFIRDDNRIIAATQILSDAGGITMSGLGLVDKAYRDKGIAAYIIGHAIEEILSEGKRSFGIFTSMYGAQKYIDLGAKLVCINGKYQQVLTR